MSDKPILQQNPLFAGGGLITKMAETLFVNFPAGRPFWRLREAQQFLSSIGFAGANPDRVKAAARRNGWRVNALRFIDRRRTAGGATDGRPTTD